MSKSRVVRRVVVCALLVGCSARGAVQSATEPSGAMAATVADASADTSSVEANRPAFAQVRWFGALHAIMHEGRTGASVRLADVLPGPRAWGVGALEGLTGEVTILDDTVWLARPAPDGAAKLTHGSVDELDGAQGAALLVVANVAAWDELQVTSNVAFRELDAYLESLLVSRGEALDRPVPIRIDGTVTSLRWHVIDGSKMQPGAGHVDHARSAVSGLLAELDAQLVGFFSRAHQGVFTHMGSHSHFHVVTRDGSVSGHVDGVDLQPGARLLIARR